MHPRRAQSARPRDESGTERAPRARLPRIASEPMSRPAGIAIAIALLAAPALALGAGEPATTTPGTTTAPVATPGTGTTTSPTTTSPTTTTPGTTTPTTTTPAAPPSVFKRDRAASKPSGLSPDDVTDPYDYPDEPIVLTWSPVMGAKQYKVEISGNMAFTGVVWTKTTDQPAIAPDALLPDGKYFWRVVATDEAGVTGLPSDPGSFVKRWPAALQGLRVAAEPGGQPVTQMQLNPYMTWDPLPGAKEYETEIAPGDQFGTPTFFGLHDHVAFETPAAIGVIPDDTYRWRVRARDPKDNPGPWTYGGDFVKAWVAPNVVAPADAADVSSVFLRWDPVPGAEAYIVQITREEHTWVGPSLLINSQTTNTGFVPDVMQQNTKGMFPPEYYWWRVRPVVDGVLGTWSPVRRLHYVEPTPGPATPVLTSTGDSDSALMPHMSWTPVPGATIYRVDVATDPQFNQIVESQVTHDTDWVPRVPLLDNQIGTGYWWRVVWGAGYQKDDPHWMVDEAAVPKAQYRKQTRVVLGLADGITVPEAPVLSWSSVPGVAHFEVQLSQNRQFDPSGDLLKTTVWGTGIAGGAFNESKRLKDGTWYWRVRPIDGGGTGQTWSPVGSFTLTSPRPLVTEPEDGATVVGSPLLRWNPVAHACGYDVQLNKGPEFPTGDGVKPLQTAQTASVPTGTEVSEPGRWYWRVRPDYCEDNKGPWSIARSFKSVRPPDFGLNAIPTNVGYGDSVTVAGALSFGGVRVKKPVLLLERRMWPEDDYRFFGTIKGDARGRFAFRMRPKASASYRLRWAPTDDHPEGQNAFGVQVGPRVTMVLGSSKVARRGKVSVQGSVYPRRTVRLQALSAGGWETIRTITPRRPRFRISVRATMDPGRYRLRLLVPADKRLIAGKSKQRNLFVFDRFVVRARSGRR